jgi:hypothetical protein
MADTLRDLIRRLKFGPKSLPRSSNGEGPIKVPGVGTFSIVSVGSTSYTTGADLSFHPEGAEECASGHVRYSVLVDKDFNVEWKITQNTLNYGDYTGEVFGSRVWDAASDAINTLHERAPTSWGFHVASAIEMEINEMDRRIENLELARKFASRPGLESRAARLDGRISEAKESWGPRRTALKEVLKGWHQWCSGKDGFIEKISCYEVMNGILSQHRISEIAEDAGGPTA